MVVHVSYGCELITRDLEMKYRPQGSYEHADNCYKCNIVIAALQVEIGIARVCGEPESKLSVANGMRFLMGSNVDRGQGSLRGMRRSSEL